MKETEVKETELAEKIKEMMMQIPNIIHPTVPVGKDDSENVELQKYGEPVIPDLKFHIIQILWNGLKVLIWIVQEKLQGMGSII